MWIILRMFCIEHVLCHQILANIHFSIQIENPLYFSPMATPQRAVALKLDIPNLKDLEYLKRQGLKRIARSTESI
jgi:hypothetical protein